MTLRVSSLTLVYLMFNEEQNIGPVLNDGVAWLEDHVDDWQIVVVDDGSSDDSADVVRALADTEPRIELVQHGRNRGMGAGMRTGITSATKEHFVIFPADGQLEPIELEKILPLLDGADIVTSVYPHRHSTMIRLLMSRVFRGLLALAADIRFELEGLYVYPTAVAKELVPVIECETFFFSFELIQRGVERGLTIDQTVINVKPRLSGESKVANAKRVQRIFDEVRAYRRRRASER